MKGKKRKKKEQGGEEGRREDRQTMDRGFLSHALPLVPYPTTGHSPKLSHGLLTAFQWHLPSSNEEPESPRGPKSLLPPLSAVTSCPCPPAPSASLGPCLLLAEDQAHSCLRAFAFAVCLPGICPPRHLHHLRLKVSTQKSTSQWAFLGHPSLNNKKPEKTSHTCSPTALL